MRSGPAESMRDRIVETPPFSAQPVCWAQRHPRGAASAALHGRASHVAAVFPPILQVMTLRLTPGQGPTASRDGSRVWTP